MNTEGVYVVCSEKLARVLSRSLPVGFSTWEGAHDGSYCTVHPLGPARTHSFDGICEGV